VKGEIIKETATQKDTRTKTKMDEREIERGRDIERQIVGNTEKPRKRDRQRWRKRKSDKEREKKINRETGRLTDTARNRDN
jgi:hypothetical protein